MKLLLRPDASSCASALVAQLSQRLAAGEQVLWFMTGGSNIGVDVSVMQQLDTELTANLTITLTDERYGDYGHADSNWQQLQTTGLDSKQARVIEVLQRDNQSLEQTTAIFASNLDVALQEADSVIGFYGLGSDGHIAGILPHSSAVDSSDLAVGYNSDPFRRITTTFATIRRCDVAYMYAGGESKLQPLQTLQTDVSLDEQPAQVLKQLPAAYIYNDQIGDPS